MQDFIIDNLDMPILSEGVDCLKGVAKIARAGILYYQHEGQTYADFRPPEEVEKLVDQLKVLPITLNHPPEMVNAKNYRVYNRGTLSGGNFQDNWLEAQLVVQDNEAMEAAENSHAQFSIGATVDREYKQGEWVDDAGVMGEPGATYKYDRIQRNLKLNHLALVTQARSGKEATWTIHDSAENDSLVKVYYSVEPILDSLTMTKETENLETEVLTDSQETNQEESSTKTEEQVNIADMDSRMQDMQASLADMESKLADMTSKMEDMAAKFASSSEAKDSADEPEADEAPKEVADAAEPTPNLDEQFAKLAETLTQSINDSLGELKQQAISQKLVAGTQKIQDSAEVDPYAEFRKSYQRGN